jgi:hypothetical protein
MTDEDDPAIVETLTTKKVTHTINITQEALGELLQMLREWKRMDEASPEGLGVRKGYIYERLENLYEQGAR